MFRGIVLLLVFPLATPGNLRAQQTESRPVKPINLEKLNTAGDEDDPHVSSNGLTLFYSSRGAKKKWDLLMSRRANQGQPWPAGKPVGDYIQSEADDRSAYLTADGRYPQYLHFATKKDRQTDNFDLFVAVKQDRTAAFTAPTPLSTLSSDHDELHPWLAAGGRELYFSRRTREGWRLMLATRQEATGAGGFGEPKLLDFPTGFHHATLTADGKTMYLQGPLEGQRWGLFRSTRTGAAWSNPEPLEQLNHPDGKQGDCSPCLSRDGFWLYFSSDRPGGKGGMDLYMVRVSELKKKG
jgi:hypothetical protein